MDGATGLRVRAEDVGDTLAATSLGVARLPLSPQAPRRASPQIEHLAPMTGCWAAAAGMPVRRQAAPAPAATSDGEIPGRSRRRATCPAATLTDVGAPLGLRASGFHLRELARLEAAFARAGRDYLGAFAAIDPAHARTPFELGAGHNIAFDKPFFNGRAALARLAAVPARRLVRLAVEGLEPARFTAVHANGRQVGIATTTGFAKTTGQNIALATLPTPHAPMAGAGGGRCRNPRRTGAPPCVVARPRGGGTLLGAGPPPRRSGTADRLNFPLFATDGNFPAGPFIDQRAGPRGCCSLAPPNGKSPAWPLGFPEQAVPKSARPRRFGNPEIPGVQTWKLRN